MKRILLVAVSLLLLAVSAGAQALLHVDDKAGVLNYEEVQKLEQQASELFEQTVFDVIIHTTRNSQGKGPRDYSFDYYHGFRDASAYPNGAALVIMFDTRDYYEAARGSGITLLTYRESHDLGRVVQNKLSNQDYYGAFSDYIRYVKRLQVPASGVELLTEYMPYVLIAGLLIGLVYALVLKSRMNIAKFRYDADAYVVPNSLNLHTVQDLYLYQTVTRTKIESSSGSKGSGGGFSTGSRGGTSYGGRGGKF